MKFFDKVMERKFFWKIIKKISKIYGKKILDKWKKIIEIFWNDNLSKIYDM